MIRIRRRARAATIAATTATALFVAGAPAMAAETPAPADATAAAIGRAAPDRGAVVDPSAEGEVLNATASQTSVDVPVDPANDITVSTVDTTTEPDLSVSLPAGLDLESATVADDGTVVYPAANGDTSAAVQVLNDGSTRIQTVIPQVGAAHEFTYTFGDDVIPVLRPDGGADLTMQSDGETLIIGSVDAPWAIDADGHSVDTHYAVHDGRLTQIVATGPNVAYPVVADPTVTVGWGLYIHYTRADIDRVTSGLLGQVNSRGKYVAVICAAIPNAVAAAACGLMTYDMLNSIWNTVLSAKNSNTCMVIHIVGAVPVGWNREACS